MTNDPLLPHRICRLPKHEGREHSYHAAVNAGKRHVYVAHTANDAVDVFDPASRKHCFQFRLPGVAGVLVSDEAQLHQLVETGETRSVFARPRSAGAEDRFASIQTGRLRACTGGYSFMAANYRRSANARIADDNHLIRCTWRCLAEIRVRAGPAGGRSDARSSM